MRTRRKQNKYRKSKYNRNTLKKNYKRTRSHKNIYRRKKNFKKLRGGVYNTITYQPLRVIKKNTNYITTIKHGGSQDLLSDEVLEIPLEGTEQINAYILEKLQGQYSSLSEEDIDSILFAAKTYSTEYDGLLGIYILNYIKNDNNFDIDKFKEISEQWVIKFFMGDFMNSTTESDDHIFKKYTEPCRAININIEERNPIETVSLMYRTMKERCIKLDKELIVYRSMYFHDSTNSGVLNIEFNDFTSTTYDPYKMFRYMARGVHLDDIIIKKIEEGQETLDFSDDLTGSIILKIKLPKGLNVFNTDICGPGESGQNELVILDQCKLITSSVTELNGNSELLSAELDYWIEDFKDIYEDDYEDDDDYDLSKLKVDKNTIKVKLYECTLSVNKEQIDYNQVIMEPLLREYASADSRHS